LIKTCKSRRNKKDIVQKMTTNFAENLRQTWLFAVCKKHLAAPICIPFLECQTLPGRVSPLHDFPFSSFGQSMLFNLYDSSVLIPQSSA
jgi:hypothetical protein